MIEYVILCNCGYQVSEDIANKYSTIHLDKYKFDRADTCIQGLTISHGEHISLINPAINIIVIIVITIIALSLYLYFQIFKIKPICGRMEHFFCLVQRFVCFPLYNIKLPNDAFCH
jgi:hypothetical protein